MKKIQRYTALWILLLAASAFQVANEPAFVAQLRKALTEYQRSFPQEKVYVQTDKTLYKPGEVIWFNAFLLDANSYEPSAVSDVLYFELIDPKGNVISDADRPVEKGTAHGDFRIDVDDPGGIYQLRAYTRWQRNFGEERFFTKKITVQQVITPRLLLKLDFEKEAYGAGDTVTAELDIKTLQNQEAVGARLQAQISLKGKAYLEQSYVANAQGLATLKFALPDTLSSTDGLLNVKVSYNGYEESISRSVPIVLNNISLQLLPEGGQYVAGVKSRIAFKALNEFGKGADVRGVIIDEAGAEVSQFESFHMGMGAFELTAEKGKSYFARIESPAGNERPVPLPATQNITINLARQDSTRASVNLITDRPLEVMLVANTPGEIIYTEQVRLMPGSNAVNVNTAAFPIGLCRFTVFSLDGIPLSERVVFVNPHKQLNIKLEPDKESYRPRGKVKLSVTTTDENDNPVSATLSLAVVDDQLLSFADDKQDNLLTSMFLSSEVKGEIEEPSYYFDPEEEEAIQALDYLLMTQGWRRFDWKETVKPSQRMMELPENSNSITGVVLNKAGKPMESEITLLELGGKHRIITIKTSPEGYFVFKGLDGKVPITLLTKKPEKPFVPGVKNSMIALSPNTGGSPSFNIISTEVGDNTGEENRPEQTRRRATRTNTSLNLSLESGSLNEVVVVGMGIKEVSSLSSSSVATVQTNEIPNSANSVAFMLMGRVPGIQIHQATGNPGAAELVRIRGINSLAASNGEALYVIDGIPLDVSTNKNFGNGSIINPREFKSIKVINPNEAVTLYGARAANGAVVIETKSGYYDFGLYDTKPRPLKYNGLRIQPRSFTATRTYYGVPGIGYKKERSDFRTTVYWNPTVTTDDAGKASVSFNNNDAVSSFRIVAEGVSQTGQLGRSEESYYTLLPFSMDARFPEFLGYEDEMIVPLQIRNETDKPLTGRLTITKSRGLIIDENVPKVGEIPAKSARTFYIKVRPKGVAGSFYFHAKFNAQGHEDAVSHTYQVRPAGFPASYGFSAAGNHTELLRLPEVEGETLEARLRIFPDVLSELAAGSSSILREPHGCFEQVSSSNYPNILALEFLQNTGTSDPETVQKAKALLSNGYKKLTAYEIRGGGFEWFGRPAAHEALTAFGLIQFEAMKEVLDEVDPKMLERTRKWLLKRRDGSGGFKQKRGKYGFASAPEEVNNAYIVYALTVSGVKDIEREYKAVLAEARASGDLYRMALVALSALNLAKVEDYKDMVQRFKASIAETGWKNMQANSSIVRSYGKSFQVEVQAMWTLALIKGNHQDMRFIQNMVEQIAANRYFGGFGSTQATGLALQALSAYAQKVKTKRSDGLLDIIINGEAVDTLSFTANNRKAIVSKDFAAYLQPNQTNDISVRFRDEDKTLPYSVDVSWYTKTPASNSAANVRISTALSKDTVALNETVRLTTEVRNITENGLPMTMAIVGIPAGLSLQPWQLKELQEKEVFDFYEIMNGNLVLYYRGLGPNEVKTIGLDLKADVPGSYTGVANSSYLYYTDEYKHYTKGNSIVIRP